MPISTGFALLAHKKGSQTHNWKTNFMLLGEWVTHGACENKNNSLRFALEMTVFLGFQEKNTEAHIPHSNVNAAVF